MQNLQAINSHDALQRHAEASATPEAGTLAKWFEPCLSCGRRFTGTAAVVTVLCVEGRQEVCKVCPACAKRRRLI